MKNYALVFKKTDKGTPDEYLAKVYSKHDTAKAAVKHYLGRTKLMKTKLCLGILIANGQYAVTAKTKEEFSLLLVTERSHKDDVSIKNSLKKLGRKKGK